MLDNLESNISEDMKKQIVIEAIISGLENNIKNNEYIVENDNNQFVERKINVNKFANEIITLKTLFSNEDFSSKIKEIVVKIVNKTFTIEDVFQDKKTNLDILKDQLIDNILKNIVDSVKNSEKIEEIQIKINKFMANYNLGNESAFLINQLIKETEKSTNSIEIEKETQIIVETYTDSGVELTKDTKMAYVELLTIIDKLGSFYKELIPARLLRFFNDNKEPNYIFNYSNNESLISKKASSKTMALLAMLNLESWCTTAWEKERLVEIYQNNDENYKNFLKEKEMIDKLFDDISTKKEVKSKMQEVQEEVEIESEDLVDTVDEEELNTEIEDLNETETIEESTEDDVEESSALEEETDSSEENQISEDEMEEIDEVQLEDVDDFAEEVVGQEDLEIESEDYFDSKIEETNDLEKFESKNLDNEDTEVEELIDEDDLEADTEDINEFEEEVESEDSINEENLDDKLEEENLEFDTEENEKEDSSEVNIDESINIEDEIEPEEVDEDAQDEFQTMLENMMNTEESESDEVVEEDSEEESNSEETVEEDNTKKELVSIKKFSKIKGYFMKVKYMIFKKLRIYNKDKIVAETVED